MAAKRKFAVFDIDGTLIRWQLYHAIVEELASSGAISPKAYAIVRAARDSWERRTHEESFVAYEQELVRVYSGALTKLSETQ